MDVYYDPSVIQEFAERLYNEASSLTLNSTIFWAFIFSGISPFAVVLLEYKDLALPAVVVGAMLGAVIGYNRGREQAFKLRLEAQVALCQVQIEKNSSSKCGI